MQLHSSLIHHASFQACVCVCVCVRACVCWVGLMVRKEREEMGSSSSVSALMWPSFESRWGGGKQEREKMCLTSEKRRQQHLAPKCSFSRELVAFTEVRSASQKRMRAAYLAGTHTHTHTHRAG